MSRLKFGAGTIESYRFSFSVVFLLSLLPIMPVTVINFGAGLSHMQFMNYLFAHFIGLTPRAFAFGFLGDTLLEPGSRRFYIGLLILLLIGFASGKREEMVRADGSQSRAIIRTCLSHIQDREIHHIKVEKSEMKTQRRIKYRRD